MFAAGAELRLSVSAQMSRSSTAVPTIWSSSGPHHDPPKYSAGKVAKIAKVSRDSLRGVPALALKASIAQL